MIPPAEDTTPRRIGRLARRAGRYLFIDRPTIGLLLAVAVMTIGGIVALANREENRAMDERALDARIVDSARDACYRANKTRAGVRLVIDNLIGSAQKQKAEARKADPNDYPIFTKAQFRELVARQIKTLDKAIEGLRMVRKKVHNAPCAELYPKVK